MPEGERPRNKTLRLARTVCTVTTLALIGLTACRPLYFPPVPNDGLPEPSPVRLSSESGLTVGADGRPTLRAVVVGLSGAGWLAVQWFGPKGSEVASESAWLEPDAPSAEFVLPADVSPASGEWRAVVSFGGRLLRQYLLTLP